MCHGNGIVNVILPEVNLSTAATLWLFMRSHNLQFNRIELSFARTVFTIKYGDFEKRFDGENSEAWQIYELLGLDDYINIVQYVEIAMRDKHALNCLTKNSHPSLIDYFNGIIIKHFDPLDQIKNAFHLFDKFMEIIGEKGSFEGFPELALDPRFLKWAIANNMFSITET